MMKYFGVLILLVITIITSCKKVNKIELKESDVSQELIVVSKLDVETIKYVEYVLDRKAKNILTSWQTYTDVISAINEFKKAEFKFFNDNEEIFSSTIDELEMTIPDKINTIAISSRILVLKTKLLKLKQQLELSNTSKKEKLQALKEVFLANENVTLQINKKFEKEAQNIIKPY